jgi:hypothetical protein
VLTGIMQYVKVYFSPKFNFFWVMLVSIYFYWLWCFFFFFKKKTYKSFEGDFWFSRGRLEEKMTKPTNSFGWPLANDRSWNNNRSQELLTLLLSHKYTKKRVVKYSDTIILSHFIHITIYSINFIGPPARCITGCRLPCWLVQSR